MNEKGTSVVAARPEDKPAGSAEQRVSKSLTVRPGRPQHLVLHTPRFAGRDATDRDFLPAALAIVEEPLSPARVAFVYSLCALLATALLWACFSKLDVFAVAPGNSRPPVARKWSSRCNQEKSSRSTPKIAIG